MLGPIRLYLRHMFLADKHPKRPKARTFVFVSANQGGGGSEELWIQTAGFLRENGSTVIALTEWAASAKRVKQLEAMGVTHIALHRSQNSFIKAFDRVFKRESRAIRCLESCLRRIRPNMVVFNSGTLVDGIDLLEHIHLLQLPCAVITHLVSSDNWPDDNLAARIQSAYSSAVAVGFVSEHNRKLYFSQIGESLTNSVIVRNPFLVSRDHIPFPEISPTSPVRLALPARLHPRTKGQDILFEVLARPEWRTRNLQVSLFGKGGCDNALRKLSNSLEISDKVFFAGHVDDMNEVWRTHHALVLPSRHEGLPIAMIEAMWAGRLVIATPAGGIPEMITNGQTGFLAYACTADALNKAMNEAWQQQHRWATMGEEGRKLVQDRIPADPVSVWVHQLENLIDSCLFGSSGKP